MQSPDTTGILRDLEREPVVDGFSHPAESAIAALVCADAQALGEWLWTLPFGVAADALRIDHPLPIEWKQKLVSWALSHADVYVRDAAVQAVESWGGAVLVHQLRNHSEAVPWLADYIRRVIDDLGSVN